MYIFNTLKFIAKQVILLNFDLERGVKIKCEIVRDFLHNYVT